MSATEAPLISPAPKTFQSSLTGTDVGLSQLRVIRSEWTNLVSLRSTIITLFLAALFFIGLGMLHSYITVHRWDRLDPRERAHFDAVNVAMTGIFLAQLAMGVLGVLLVSGEYSTGMIRATFSAVPRRLPVLWGKLVVFAVVGFVLMFAAALIAFFASQQMLSLSSHHLTTTIGHPGVLRAVTGGAAYLTLIGLMGIGLGALLRNTAGGISSLAGLLFVVPVLANVTLPQSWNDTISPYFPSHAGESLFSLHGPDPTSLSPGPALAVMFAYVAVFVATAAVAMLRRDA